MGAWDDGGMANYEVRMGEIDLDPAELPGIHAGDVLTVQFSAGAVTEERVARVVPNEDGSLRVELEDRPAP